MEIQLVKKYGYRYRSKWTFSWSRRTITVIAVSDSSYGWSRGMLTDMVASGRS